MSIEKIPPRIGMQFLVIMNPLPPVLYVGTNDSVMQDNLHYTKNVLNSHESSLDFCFRAIDASSTARAHNR